MIVIDADTLNEFVKGLAWGLVLVLVLKVSVQAIFYID